MSDNKNGLSDVLQKGVQTANTVKGAIKTGKSITAAAKGGTAGGWIGAVAAVAWENRRLVAMITLGIVVLLLLPMVIISMLPSLIFGGTNDAYSPTDTSNPILNNPSVITENFESAKAVIKESFTEGLDLVLEKIEEDKAALPENTNIEIIQPTIEETNINVALVISQYCAYKNDDYRNISLADMENILNANKDKFYKYEKTEELRPIETEETENIVTEEQVTVYTVIYNGEEYLADNIFHLSTEQKNLANNYAENLSLFLSGGI